MEKIKADSTQECVRKLKVLADKARLSVLELLMAGPKHVWELNEFLKMDQSLLSHHLRVLRQEDLVETVRHGKSILYRLTRKTRSTHTPAAINLGCCLLSFPK